MRSVTFRFDAGAKVTLASPMGGQPPLDPKSDEKDFQTPATKRFQQDEHARGLLAQTQKLGELRAQDYDAVFYPGGHGPLWDLVEDDNSKKLIEAFWRAEKPVAAVCHASAVLLNANDSSGRPLVQGRRVTGFTNAEEAAVGLTEVVPFLVEDALKNKGALFDSGNDWAPFTQQDGRLITGQNPASSAQVAELMLKVLDK
ncbi:MAG: type 1 glutamine amidotransferase domain-containing protein [Myxococcota bacterium]